jgi:hypothetical protein
MIGLIVVPSCLGEMSHIQPVPWAYSPDAQQRHLHIVNRFVEDLEVVVFAHLLYRKFSFLVKIDQEG